MGRGKDEALRLLRQGVPVEQVARQTGESPGSVRAWKAHETMGTYGRGRRSAGHEASASLLQEAADDYQEAAEAESLKFGLEKDLQDALRRNISQLDPHLRLVDDGKERQVLSGRIDILAEDRDGRLVVIELKAAAAPDDVIAQILGYMGDLSEETGRDVLGIVIAREFSNRVRSAGRRVGLRLIEYGYQFTFEDA